MDSNKATRTWTIGGYLRRLMENNFPLGDIWDSATIGWLEQANEKARFRFRDGRGREFEITVRETESLANR